MGLFSFITDLFVDDPAPQIDRVAEGQLEFQQRGLDYLQEINRLPLEYRDQAMQSLMGYYGGDPEVQQSFVDRARSSPFYESMIQQGQEGVLRNAGSMGLSRSGNAASALNRSNQAVLQNLVNQQLGGLQGFAGTPISGQGVAGMLGQMGQTVGSAGMAGINARQSQQGNVLGGLLGLGGLFLSDERLKENVRPLWKEGDHNIYAWTWNDEAEKFGLYGAGVGVIAQEIEQSNPSAVSLVDGYLAVDYKQLGLA